jgi:multiple antibiotic resistance protein
VDHPSVHFVTVLMAFFAIMNPIANAPIFVGLTREFDLQTRRLVALRAVLLAFAIVAVFSLGGRTIFTIFGITLPAFRIAGGLLVGLVGYHMLQGEPSVVHSPREEDNEMSRDAALDIAISPLALPILAGPGTIATAMSFSAESTLPGVIRVIVAFGLICAVTWVTFLTGQSLSRFLGQSAIKVVTRLMGLILAVIGVQMLIEGVRGAVALSSVS